MLEGPFGQRIEISTFCDQVVSWPHAFRLVNQGRIGSTHQSLPQHINAVHSVMERRSDLERRILVVLDGIAPKDTLFVN